MFYFDLKLKGFTLFELLIVISIIAIIASVVFVALDPLTRFQNSRDAVRWQDIHAILDAVKLDQIDNGGAYLSEVAGAGADSVYMITDGVVIAGCSGGNGYCDTNVNGDNYCLDLSDLITEGYLADIPVSPQGDGNWSDSLTGYTLERNANGIITVRACESESSTEIMVAR